MNRKRIKKDKYPGATPSQLTPAILEFARELGGVPQYVPHKPLPFAQELQCINNCDVARQLGLGTPALGWSIWATRNLWLSAEYHCVLKSKGGLVDITPTDCSGRILFVPDGREVYDHNIDEIDEYLQSLPSERWSASKLLVNHPLVRKAVDTLQQGACVHHRTGNSDWNAWNRQVDEIERLLDAYLGQQSRPSRKTLRARKKAERQRRKKARR